MDSDNNPIRPNVAILPFSNLLFSHKYMPLTRPPILFTIYRKDEDLNDKNKPNHFKERREDFGRYGVF